MLRWLVLATIGSIALAFAAPAVGSPSPAQLTVANTAQPGLESDVPQAPVWSAARGSCATPYSAHEANTGISPCPPGSWPSNDAPTGGDWRPEVRVAGRDRLELAFDAPPEEVRYGSTTNFPRGLRNPAGAPHPNVDIITARDAQPTGDAHVWTVVLPRFDDSGHPPGSGYTFSVVARTGTTWRSFAFSIRGPRWNDDRTRCGFFWSPEEFDRTFCIFSYLPGRPPLGTADRRPPTLRVRVPHRQRVLRLRQARAYVRCDEPCTVRISGRLRVGRRSYKLAGRSARVPPGERRLLRVHLPSLATRALRRALRRERRANIVLGLRARDATGNRSDPTKRRITPR